MLMSEKSLEMVAERFRILGDPQRLRLLSALSGGERSVADLVESTGTGQANVSKHLGVLLRGGLVRRRKDGLRVFYEAADKSVYQICDVVCGSLKDHLARELSQLEPARVKRRKAAPARP